MINCTSKKLEYLDETEKFLKTHILPNLTPIENLNTSMRSRVEEIKNLPTRKSPGPNGITEPWILPNYKEELRPILLKHLQKNIGGGNTPNTFWGQ